MSKKITYSILMAVFSVGLFIGILENYFLWGHILISLLAMGFISLNLVTQLKEKKSPAWFFMIVAVFLIFIYFVFKELNSIGTYISGIIGFLCGIMIYYGWILPYKPFSREEYTSRKKEIN